VDWLEITPIGLALSGSVGQILVVVKIKNKQQSSCYSDIWVDRSTF
jgi:hypothetical protein